MPLPEAQHEYPEQRVLRQLVEALLFEQRLPWGWQAFEEGDFLCWQQQGDVYRCRAHVGAFDRVRIRAGSLQRREGDDWQPAGLARLLATLPALDDARQRLTDELAQTVRLCRWNQRRLNVPLSRRGLDYAGLESALDEGHPYHPCFKARTGFSEQDHEEYGPEAGRSFRLVWLAVPRAHLRQALAGDEQAFWQDELGEPVWRCLSERLHRQGGDWHRHGLLPLHPWQWQQLRGRLGGLGQSLFLGEAGDHYQASQSVRTLLNVSHPERASIKLAMSMVNTSSKRIIEPHSVCTAPVISRWLQQVVNSDALFAERYPLVLLAEYAGVIADDQGELAAIWRQSLTPLLGEQERAVPFNALMMVERDGRPFADDWIGRHGLEPWLNRLFEVVVLPVWHLLVAHGIALEAHGQNMVLLHEHGWPSRLVLRDFHESVEYVPGFLRDPGLAPDFSALDPCYRQAEPNQYYWMETPEWLRELVMDTLFVFNLSEVSWLLECHYGLPEARFWSLLAIRLAAHAEEHGLQARLAELGHDAATFYTESLLTRKLSGNRVECHHLVSNPLSPQPTPVTRAESNVVCE
ncbi:IucA/IucC family protein [Oceanimonas doudoroffii]|uniref:Rhizobactin siderophore biosynthesis protein RhsF n=1 Tax=Oceanimonas doudoroffii TaxID=84158 RepID=A0A233RAK2_9GAMM|nr:IucA/IucC family protein [Oceanimonas doudoroffii]OXY80434.1 rhizobactin siderophore biosynthesis protein RhsF [Oceanimonas doudoroffii]